MAQQVIQNTIPSPGLEGLNTELGSSMPDPRFAIVADNVVIDRVGRIQSREAFSYLARPPFIAPTNHSITQMGAYYVGSYTQENAEPNPMCVVRAEEYIFGDVAFDPQWEMASYQPHSGKFAVESLPYKMDWRADFGSFVNFKDDLYFFCKGKPVVRRTQATKEWQDLSTADGFQGPVYDDEDRTDRIIDGDIACSAYGRLWVAGVDDNYQEIHYSSLLDELTWYDGRSQAPPDNYRWNFNDAGIINVQEYWPVEVDRIVGIAAHNGFLVVFGNNSTLVFANASRGDPASSGGIFLQDAIPNVGLVDKHAITDTGSDLLFVDRSGLRSLGRVVQEKSNPMAEPSLNVRRVFRETIEKELAFVSRNELAGIQLEYQPDKANVIVLFKSQEMCYVFSTNGPSVTGGWKATTWSNCYFYCMKSMAAYDDCETFFGGKNERGLLLYKGYQEQDKDGADAPYTMSYESTALNLSQSTLQNIIPKSFYYVVYANSIPAVGISNYGFGQFMAFSEELNINVKGGSKWNVDRYAIGKFGLGEGMYWNYKVNTRGAGTHMRIGLQIEVNGDFYALHEIAVNYAIGRIAA